MHFSVIEYVLMICLLIVVVDIFALLGQYILPCNFSAAGVDKSSYSVWGPYNIKLVSTWPRTVSRNLSNHLWIALQHVTRKVCYYYCSWLQNTLRQQHLTSEWHREGIVLAAICCLQGKSKGFTTPAFLFYGTTVHYVFGFPFCPKIICGGDFPCMQQSPAKNGKT